MDSQRHEKSGYPPRPQSLRLLPGIFIVVLQWLMWFGIPLILPGDGAVLIGVAGGILGGLALLIWWAFFSRAHKSERWGAIALIIIALAATSRLLDKSIATSNMGMMFIFYSIPMISLAFVSWVVFSRHLSDRLRRAGMVVTIILASGVWALLRTDGMTGHLHNELRWRWAETNEERFLTQTSNETMTLPVTAENSGTWPGFRGADRDGIVHGVKIGTDWKTNPPKELWRRPIGPGCSSFAISDGLIYTQEQRGDDEVVTCYNLNTGKPVWIHSDKARFWDAHAGAGPRATPTLYAGRIYTFGGTGIVNVLNASDGSVVWSRNASSDTGAKDSGWGFTSSPLVIGDMVIIAATGKLVGYDTATGEPRWYGPDSGKGYSSPHLMTLDGVPQILLMSTAGLTSLTPVDGTLIWEHAWPMDDPVVQPAVTPGGDILLSGSLKNGIRRISVNHQAEGWKIKEQWTSSGLRPYFNDFIVHNDHAYGFDGLSLACISIENGKRIWRGGRYGGQIILLADQDLILLLSEKGELALISATPDKFTELARFPAITGKTWNHPVLAGNIVLVRNSNEMTAFRLPAPN
jgi:outer membrane protein assembly factor BamB